MSDSPALERGRAGRPRKLTDFTEKTIARRYKTGKWTIVQLAEHYQIAVGTVRAIIARQPNEPAGEPPPTNTNPLPDIAALAPEDAPGEDEFYSPVA